GAEIALVVALDAFEPLEVDAGETDDVRRRRLVWIEAPRLGDVAEAVELQRLQRVTLARRRGALQPDEGLTALELRRNLLLAQTEHREGAAHARAVGHLSRAEKDRGTVDARRQGLAMAVEDRAAVGGALHV